MAGLSLIDFFSYISFSHSSPDYYKREKMRHNEINNHSSKVTTTGKKYMLKNKRGATGEQRLYPTGERKGK
jgi:hypothetical protein